MNNIRKLISEMSLEEKASLCSGNDNWHTKSIERLGIPAIRTSDGPHGLRIEKNTKDEAQKKLPSVFRQPAVLLQALIVPCWRRWGQLWELNVRQKVCRCY